MKKDDSVIAQNGASMPAQNKVSQENSMLDWAAMEEKYNDYTPADLPEAPGGIPFKGLDTSDPYTRRGSAFQDVDEERTDSLEELNKFASTPGDTRHSNKLVPLSELNFDRYNSVLPGYNNEDAHAQNQGVASKMLSGVGKGLLLTGTTFLQSTAGLVNGIYQASADGRAASFYDNDFNRAIDEINRKAEDFAPNYYTDVEKNARWYSPDKLVTANFFWDGIVKNLGFAAGAGLAGGVFAGSAKALSSLPLASRLFSVGKAAETLAGVEKGLASANKAADTYGKIRSLSDSFLGSYKALNTGQRVLVAGLSTTGEAGFEAYHNLNEFRNTKIEEYKIANNGQEPIGDDLQRINAAADAVGNSSFALNVALLSATNYVQFPKILGSSYTVEKGMINGLTKQIGEIAQEGGRFVVKPAGNKVLEAVKSGSKYLFAGSEGFEDGAQFAIQKGTQDYYNKKYNNQNAEWLDSLVEGVKTTLTTDEGMENILIGGLSGALMMGRGNYKQGKEQAINTAQAIESFNKAKLSDFTSDTIDSVNRGVVLQEQREKALKQGNILDSKDLEADYIINYLTPRIKYGRMDLVTAELNDYKQLAATDEGFNQLVQEGKALPSDTKEAYFKRLLNLEQTATNIKSLYQSLNLRYSGMIDENGTSVYPPEIIDKMVYGASKIVNYDIRIPQVTAEIISAGLPVDQIVEDVIKGELSSFDSALAKIKGMTTLTDDQQQTLIENLEDIAVMSIRRNQILQEYNDIKKKPENFISTKPEDTVVSSEEVDGEKDTIEVVTKDGKRLVEIGTEYVLGKVTEYSAKGNEVYRQPRLTILGRNEDGTIKIKASNGVIKDITEGELESYNLVPARLMETNKKFKFFEAHQNMVFRHLGLKKPDGTPREGRLEYNNKKNKLTFVYVDEKGDVKRKEVWNTLFTAQEGYKQAMIFPISKLTAAQQIAEKEFTSEKMSVSDKLQTRNDIITELYKSSVERLEDVNKKITTRKEALAKDKAALQEKITKEITKGNLTVKGTARKRPNLVLNKLISNLSKLEEDVDLEIIQLTNDKEELEGNIPFFKAFLDDIVNLPESGKEMISQLREDINGLENLIDATNQAIKENKSLLKQIQAILGKALDVFNDYIKRLKEDNPNIPLYVEDLMTSIEKFYGDENARQIISNKEGLTSKVLELEEDLNSFSEELSIPKLTKEADKLISDITELEISLENMINTQAAKRAILDSFEQYAENEKLIQEESKKLQHNENLKKAFIGTLTDSIQNFFGNKSYESASKKSNIGVVTSTRPFDDGRPHQQRANTFGFNFSKFKNKDKLKAVIVTPNTQGLIIPGLTEHFLSDITDSTKLEKASKEAIFLVIVDEEGNPVDQEGKTIPRGDDLINNAIYQVFPSSELKGTYYDNEGNAVVGSMFREDISPEEKEFLTNSYIAWRTEQLEQTELGSFMDFTPSFGLPELATWTDQNGVEHVDTTARTSAQSAGLITSNSLRQEKLIEIPTTNTAVSEGSVVFETPKGRVFLRVPGLGMAKLFNRKFSVAEATTIYDVMLQITKNASADGELKQNSKKLFKWLNSIVYWGIAKDANGKRKEAGYNNVWFEYVLDDKGEMVQKLFISGLVKESSQAFDFTPTGLEARKQDIIFLLQQLYLNTDAAKVNNSNTFTEPYEQITGINTDGNPIITKWPNYQTFLLSDKAPDNTGKLSIERDSKEIPLATQFRPITAERPTNRKAIYFSVEENLDMFVMPEKVEAITKELPTSEEVTESTIEQTEEAPVSSSTIVYDGVTENHLFSDKAGDLYFTAGDDIALTITLNREKSKAAMDALRPKVKQQDDDYIAAALEKSLHNKLMQDPQPVSDIKKEIKETAPNGQFVLDGKTLNLVSNPDFGRIVFTATKEGVVTLDLEQTADAIKKLSVSDSSEDLTYAASRLHGGATTRVKTFIAEQSIPKEAPIVDAPIVEESQPTPTVTKRQLPTATPVDKSKVYRLKRVKEAVQFQTEDWKNVEQFLSTNFPNLPFYRVKNMIQATNGRQAWGMLHDAAIYVVDKAEVGTAYHEVFEAVWKMFAGPKEKQTIIDEFRNRTGSYTDSFTGETIEYSKATPEQLKEEIAEEFREFILTGKTVTRKQGKNLISRMFHELMDFIRTFFTGKEAVNNTQELFNKIGNGYYAKYNPYAMNLSYAKEGIIDIASASGNNTSEFRINSIPEVQLHDIMQHMTYRTLSKFAETNESLFNVQNPNKIALYKELKEEITNLVNWERDVLIKAVALKEVGQADVEHQINNLEDLYFKIEDEWENIIEEHKILLKSYDVTFDENDDLQLESEESTSSGKSDYVDADKIDSFRKANSAVKLMLATLPELHVVNGRTEWKLSTIGGVTLMPADKVFIQLVSELHTARNVEEMLTILSDMASKNINYKALYKRMTGKNPGKNNEKIDLSDIKEHDFQLISSFWRSLKKQNADVITVFVLPSGEVVVSDSMLSTASQQAKREMLSNMSQLIKEDKSPYFNYNKQNKKYYASALVKQVGKNKLNPKALNDYVLFLRKLGIEFNLVDIMKLSPSQKKVFLKATDGLLESISKVGETSIITNEFGHKEQIDSAVSVISSRTLDIDKNITQLGIVKAIIDKPDFESTYFNLNGEKSQTFIGTNIISDLHDMLSKISNVNELMGTPYEYLLTDEFAKGSVMLSKMFDMHVDGDGGRIAGTENLFKPTIIDGTNNENTGKKKQSSKQSLKERIVQEINLNLAGKYSNLVPGDASLEYAVTMHEEGQPFVSEDSYESGSHLEIMRDYFFAEINLSRQNRNIAKVKGRNSKDLRFFKGILGTTLHDILVSEESNLYSAEELYYGDGKKFKGFKTQIDDAINAFIKEEADDTQNLLTLYGIVETTELGLVAHDLLLGEKEQLTKASLKQKLEVLSINYIIANIELHKLVYADPYQYKDELKRIKNFNSPGQPLIHGSLKVNSVLDKLYNTNKGYKKGDIGYTDMMRDHFRSITLEDVESINTNFEEYKKAYEETDGGGLVTMKGNRIFRLRAGTWSENNEKQFIYDNAYEKTIKNIELTSIEKEIYTKGNPGIKDTYTPIKPIVRGNKANGRNYNDIVLHKFALMPVSFRIFHEINSTSNMLKLYDKMQKEDVDYAVFASGSKAGTEKVSPLYQDNGQFDNTPFESDAEKAGMLETNDLRGVSKIPFAIVAVQSEVPSKDTPLVTQGSQITKLATMDFMEAGIPIDFMEESEFEDRFVAWNNIQSEEAKNDVSPLYKEIKHNQRLLEERIQHGFDILLNKLGISQTETGFKITDRNKLINTLEDEILKREVNYNLLDALEGFKQGHVILEATPAYQQIRNILYSIADKNVVRPKISGGMKVQVSSALFESHRIPVEGVKEKVFSSDILKFYEDEDGKRYCEIMIGRWFKSDKTDEELIKYFNEDPEGKKEMAAITGMAYRIPTQKQNSIDVFKIAKFLPKEFGDSVVIPSALVKKVGSDFDIDKLSIYLKSLMKDSKGNLKVIPFKGYGTEAKGFFEDMFYDELDTKIEKTNASLLKRENLQKIFGEIAYGESSDKARNKWIPYFKEIFAEDLVDDKLSIDIVEDFFMRKIEELGKSLDALTDGDLQTIFAKQFVEDMYKKSLENEYISSLEKLTSHERNFENLIKPNDASPLSNLSKAIQEQTGEEQIDYSSVNNMLNRKFMVSLRQAFVEGKQAIGIAAVGQTGHAQRQRTASYIDIDKLKSNEIDPLDRVILGGTTDTTIFATNPDINFQKYNSAIIAGKKRPMLSFIKNKAGEFISDINGMFIDGYVDISKGPWIMTLGATPNVTSTWLFLVDLGVPIKSIAYFINQPIIKDYLRSIGNKGYSWLFIDNIVEETLNTYAPTAKNMIVKGIPGEKELWDLLVYNKEELKGTMSDAQKAQQQYMLKEFLKYAKMSSHMFNVTQGSNFDTANINDSSLVFKKKEQLKKARKTIISSVDNILNSSFVGPLKELIYDYRDAFAEILVSDKEKVRTVMEAVLLPYINMSDRNFVKIAQKANLDLFDWAVQTSPEFVQNISSILLGSATEKSAAKQVIEFRNSVLGSAFDGIAPKSDHPLFNNIILNSIKMESGSKQGHPNNLYIAGRDNKVYDQNLTIYGFNQLREYLKSINSDLYPKIVRLAVLQSGLSNSKIAFTNLLPYNDFKEIYNNTLSNLENLPNLAAYNAFNVFERNNWNNSDVVPTRRAKLKENKEEGSWYNPDLAIGQNLKRAVNEKIIPRVIMISPFSSEARQDFMTYVWEDRISKEERARRRKVGDYSHVHKILMQKVYTINDKGERIPLVSVNKSKNGVTYTKFVYKAINAWGDSFRAQEFYDHPRESVLDNGYDKVVETTDISGNIVSIGEVNDELIVNIFQGQDLINKEFIAGIKPEGITQEEWNNLSEEEKNKIKECN